MLESCTEKSIQKIFADSGCKLTVQRLEIYRQLSGCQDHPSAEVLHQRVAKNLPMVSLETVYRALNKFEKVGLISRINTTNRRGRFDANTSPHSHIICTQCGDIKDLGLDDFDISRIHLGINGWGRVDSINLILTGACRKCLEGEEKHLT